MTTQLLKLDGGTPRETARAVNLALQGKINSVGTLTLLHGAASTVVKDTNVGDSSAILLFPQTADAAAEIAAGGMYMPPVNYVIGTSFKIFHANNSQTDRVFSYAILG